MLGSRVFETLSNNPLYTVYSVGRSGTGKHHLACDLSDIRRFSKVLDELSPDVVVHCAANVNLENCEKEKDYTYKLHVAASRVISSNKHIKKSVFISTDSVFDGQKGRYKEEDFVGPLNYYALTKALAEESFLNAAHESVILRTNIFGFNRTLRSSLFEWAWHNLENNKQISGYRNVLFNPLYVGTLARIVEQLLENGALGLFHVGSAEGLSKYDFIVKIAEAFNFPQTLVKESVAENNGPVLRPLNTILDVSLIQSRYGITMPDINAELSQLFNDFKCKQSIL